MMIRLDGRSIAALKPLRGNAAAEKGPSLWRILEATGAVALPPSGEAAGRLVNFNSPEDWRRLVSE